MIWFGGHPGLRSMASGPPNAPSPNAEHTHPGVPELGRSRAHPADFPAQPSTGPAGCMSSFGTTHVTRPDHLTKLRSGSSRPADVSDVPGGGRTALVEWLGKPEDHLNRHVRRFSVVGCLNCRDPGRLAAVLPAGARSNSHLGRRRARTARPVAVTQCRCQGRPHD